MEKLCIHYGKRLGTISGAEYVYYDFPSPSVLADPSVEQRLRELGFGYRAKYIQATAHMIAHVKTSGWLSTLRTKSYAEAKESLLELSGVGPKVADCVVRTLVVMKLTQCLFSLNQPSAVPVDTHVWQIAARDYKFRLKGTKVASMTKDVYNGVGDFFRNLWGDYAGWAHSVPFLLVATNIRYYLLRI
jgi:N-glycosylase/DNA lyase